MKKENQEKVIVILTILLFLALLYFFIKMFDVLNDKNSKTVAVSTETQIFEIFKNENPINIDEIIDENRNINIREEMIYEEIDLEYTTQYINNDELPSGTIHVSQIGINGTQDVITIKRYDGDELISDKIVANNVKKTSVNKIVEIGTGRRKK